MSPTTDSPVFLSCTYCPIPTRPTADVLQEMIHAPIPLIAGLLCTTITVVVFQEARRHGHSRKGQQQALFTAFMCTLPVLVDAACAWLLRHVYHRSVPVSTSPLLSGRSLADLVIFLSVALNLMVAFGWFGLGRRRNT